MLQLSFNFRQAPNTLFNETGRVKPENINGEEVQAISCHTTRYLLYCLIERFALYSVSVVPLTKKRVMEVVASPPPPPSSLLTVGVVVVVVVAVIALLPF